MRVQYVGPHAAVDLALPDRQWVTVARGEVIEVPDAFGQRLIQLQLTNWRVPAEASASEGEAATPDERASGRKGSRRAERDGE